MKDGELKCFTKGQSICITSLNHCLNDILEFCLDFEKSKVLSKIKNVIYVAYGNDGKFLKWKTINLIDNYELYIKLEDDYNYISDEIKNAYTNIDRLKTITGPNKLLQIRSKASKRKDGTYKLLKYNDITLYKSGMAFYLCCNYVS